MIETALKLKLLEIWLEKFKSWIWINFCLHPKNKSYDSTNETWLTSKKLSFVCFRTFIWWFSNSCRKMKNKINFKKYAQKP